MERNIAVDSGKFATKSAMLKASGEVKTDSFLTRLDKKEIVEGFGRDKNTHSVIYEGESYILGEGAETKADTVTSKETDIHKIATYAAIANFIDNGDVVNVAAGCPLSIYSNSEKVAEYRDFLFPTGKQITITVDGVEKMFGIKKGKIFPEGSGVVLLNADKPEYKNVPVGVIDIGGLNCNGCIYKNGTPLTFTAFTNRMGGNVMVDEMRKQLQTLSSDGDPIPGFIMDTAIEFGYIQGDEKIKQMSIRVMDKVRKEHLKKILDDCQRRQWKLNMMPIIFTGGTSLRLKNEIEELCGGTAVMSLITEDVAFTNVKGFLFALTGRK